MDVRYYYDPETGEPHIYEHGVFEDEVEYVLRHAVKTGQAMAKRGMLSARRHPGVIFA